MIYDLWVPKIWTTIYMPTVVEDLGVLVTVNMDLLVAPFPCFRLVEPFFYSQAEIRAASDRDVARGKITTWERQWRDKHEKAGLAGGLRGVEDMIVAEGLHAPLLQVRFERKDSEPNQVRTIDFSSCTRIDFHYDDGKFIRKYGPENDSARERQFAATLMRFNSWTNNRTARFREQLVSRPVRRAGGHPPEYREFVVMRKGEATREQWRESEPMSKLVPLLRTMHPVRSHMRVEHLRTLRNGEIGVIPASRVVAHTRGSFGSATQVKDYRLK